MNVLIHTQTEDVHAIAVAVGLRNQGARVDLWFGSDFPGAQSISIALSPEANIELSIEDELIDGALVSDYDVVWHRRMSPAMPDQRTHPADRLFIQRELDVVMRASRELLAERAFAVNSLFASTASRNKPLQLRLAAKLGLTIPETLISNDADRIRRFILRFPDGAIHKTCTPHLWRSSDRLYGIYTSEVSMHQLDDESALRICPVSATHFKGV